jgi:arsenate reductase (thioredoxin)
MHDSVVPRSDAERIARTLRAMADPTRIQLLSHIVASPGGRRSVTELADALGLSQPTVSHHLKIMSDDGLLEREQHGRLVWYSVTPARLASVVDSVQTDPVAAVVAPPVLDRIARDVAPSFAGIVSAETVDDVVRSSYDLLAARAHVTRYLPSLTAQFAVERLRAIGRVAGHVDGGVPSVLFVCVRNAGRSQLASAIMRSLASDDVRVSTAGSEPAAAVHPLVVAALDEIGVPLGAEFPKPLTDEVVRAADVVITMGCGDACPVYPGKRYLDWDLPDPAGLTMAGVREVRDEIERRVRALLAEFA